MALRILCIGAGAMGGAILRGALQAGLLEASHVYIKEHRQSTCDALSKELGVVASTELPDLQDFDMILFGVKPQVLPSVLQEVKEKGINKETVLLSIAAGITMKRLEEALPSDKWVRAMPNTPCSIKAGFTAIAGCRGEEKVPPFVVEIFNALGEAVVVNEASLDCIAALGGAGTGFVFVIMDALADAGVRIGLTRPMAIRCAYQTLLGAGKLAQVTGEHPAVLRDQVTSPGGTTIAGINAFEAHGGRTALHEAVLTTYKRSLELGEK